jgi:hypothetical protein
MKTQHPSFATENTIVNNPKMRRSISRSIHKIPRDEENLRLQTVGRTTDLSTSASNLQKRLEKQKVISTQEITRDAEGSPLRSDSKVIQFAGTTIHQQQQNVFRIKDNEPTEHELGMLR